MDSGYSSADETDDEVGSAFVFHGNWQEFLPIALSNIALTFATLGIYRFWATARERRYLWSQTQFIDDRLEWRGTGLELFKGFIFVFGIFLLLYAGLGAMIVLEVHTGVLIIYGLLLGFGLFWLIGLARFRAVRYRLSRTYWHGIRGGSDDQGFRYGLSWIWRNVATYLTLYIATPWMMVSLWNKRWNKMSFGGEQIESYATTDKLWGKFFMIFLATILSAVLSFSIVGAMALGGAGAGAPSAALSIVAGVIFYAGPGLAFLFFYAAFFRETVGNMLLGTLRFGFQATTPDWLKLMLGNVGLGVFALIGFGIFFGIGSALGLGEMAATLGLIGAVIGFSLVSPFIRYRNWAFFARHMEAYGEVNLSAMTQSNTKRASHGEGLLDALDIGAF